MLALLFALTFTTGTPNDGCILIQAPQAGYAICLPSPSDAPELYRNGTQVGPDLNGNAATP